MKPNPFRSNRCQNQGNCPYKNLGTDMDTTASFCTVCGVELLEKTRRRPIILWNRIIGVIVLLVALGLLVWKVAIKDGCSRKQQNPSQDVSQVVSPPTSTACLQNPPARQNVLAELRKNGVRIAVESESPPFNEEVGGKPTGFDYEIAREIAKRIGIPKVEMVYTSGDYGIFPCYLNDNRADWFMGGYVQSAKFDNLVSWSNSYYPQNGYCLIVRKGSGIRTLADLQGKKVGIYDDDATERWVTEKAKANPVRFDDTGQVGGKAFADENKDQGKWMLLAIQDYNMDAIVYDYPFAVAELENCEDKLKAVEYNLGSLPYVIGLPTNNYDLLDAVNKALKEYMATQQYIDLVKKCIHRIPETQVDILPVPRGMRQHIVKPGETLSGIVLAELHELSLWPTVWEWNKSRIPNPNIIQTGDIIILEAPR